MAKDHELGMADQKDRTDIYIKRAFVYTQGFLLLYQLELLMTFVIFSNIRNYNVS